ncbi:hypothetical protein [Photobacterium damselae]|uniref:hypothetical protein n=1 Tax=Photobacterium damselae TaxID=38293 RepID=UPI0018A39111|nr:hypothetical protein [Photobacterium damselae]QOQ70987.1 hypothetical protein IL982_16730 [Photobacterium damselae subsp. damselae]
MLTIRPYQEQDAEHLWSLLFNTIRSVNIRDYSQEQVKAWAQELRLQKLYSEVSITARPFFEQYGFKVVTVQKVALRGIVLDNFLMQKA